MANRRIYTSQYLSRALGPSLYCRASSLFMALDSPHCRSGPFLGQPFSTASCRTSVVCLNAPSLKCMKLIFSNHNKYSAYTKQEKTYKKRGCAGKANERRFLLKLSNNKQFMVSFRRKLKIGFEGIFVLKI